VCPWNVRFARALPDESPYAAREALAGKDARTLAREILTMTHEEFAAAFKGSPVKRAKLRGLKRNAAVVLGNAGTAEDVDVLTAAMDDLEPLVREHAAWALGQIATSERVAPALSPGSTPPRQREGEPSLGAALSSGPGAALVPGGA
jgi:HEAT repeat protein